MPKESLRRVRQAAPPSSCGLLRGTRRATAFEPGQRLKALACARATGSTPRRNYRGLRVLLIVTFRPELEPQWIGRPHVTSLTLNRLARREIDAMIDHDRRAHAGGWEAGWIWNYALAFGSQSITSPKRDDGRGRRSPCEGFETGLEGMGRRGRCRRRSFIGASRPALSSSRVLSPR